MKPCLVCGADNEQRPMAFRGELWCSDDHRKVVKGEKEPSDLEWVAMDADLAAVLSARRND